MYVTPILLLLLASNVFADGTLRVEKLQGRFSSMGINTKETTCEFQNSKTNLDSLLNMASDQQNQVKPEASGDGNSPELTPLAADCPNYYRSSVTMTTFLGAVSSCQNAGLKIATPDTAAKMDCLRHALIQVGMHDYWIGATNRHLFYWVTTNEIANIDPEKIGGLTNLCLYIRAIDYSIHGDICTTNRRFICESA